MANPELIDKSTKDLYAKSRYAPIAVFAYNRPTHLAKTLQSLAENPEARETHLAIFCDGAKSELDVTSVNATRAVAANAKGFASVKVIERKLNLGLATSVSTGISEILSESDRVVVFEDDLIASKYCLDYVNRALNRYADSLNVAAVGCYVFPTKQALPQSFFLRVTDCFGWATWRDRWQSYEPDARALLSQIERNNLERQFDLDGAYPYTKMLRDCVAERNSSWAIRWYASQFLLGRLCLYPGVSMTRNIGMDGSGVHSGDTQMYDNALASTSLDSFPKEVKEDARALSATSTFLRHAISENHRLSTRFRRRLQAMLKRLVVLYQ